MKPRKHFRIQFLLMILYNQNNIFFCLTNDELGNNSNQNVNVIENNENTNIKIDLTSILDNVITKSTKKKSRTYKKKKTTISIRIEAINDKENNKKIDETTQAINTQPLEQTSEITTQSINPTNKYTTQRIENIFLISNPVTEILKPTEELYDVNKNIQNQINDIINKSNSNANIQEENETTQNKYKHRFMKYTTRKLLKPNHHNKFSDKRRQVVFFSHKKNFTTIKWTPKYSPFIFQNLQKNVIDLRKTTQKIFITTEDKTRRTKTTSITEATTIHRIMKNINYLRKLYDNVLIEEKEFEEEEKRYRLKEELEKKQIEESMQKSYLNQFIVREVTTESWEKNLPASSRARDEEYMDQIAAKMDDGPKVRQHFSIRKGKILARIKDEEECYQKYLEKMKTMKPEDITEKEISYYSDGNSESYEHNKKTTFRKLKFGKYTNGESGDVDNNRNQQYKKHPINNNKVHNYLHKGTTNSKWSTPFHANEYCKMMQHGWAQRGLRKVSDIEKLDKRKEDLADIYEPDPDSKDEIERMKTYEFTSNQQFILYLKENNYATNERVLEAIHWVDRERFGKDGYVDAPHNYGTNSIIERPSYQAKCLDILSNSLVPGANVLDLGFGSGFMSCCMSRLVGETGHVTSIEHIPQLINLLLTKMKITYPKFYKLLKTMDIIEWDARKPYKKNGPYDVIHFGGGVTYIPLEFISDLKVNGSILVPVGPPYGPHILKKITVIKKNVYTIQNLAEVESFHFCSPEEQVFDFRQTYGHHFIKLYPLFYKTIVPYNENITNLIQTYKLPD